ncbi:MAG: HipA N-terminal domain-containing protein [Bacteroidota bacterium]
MRSALVTWNNELAGTLTESDDRTYAFVYDDSWFYDPKKPAISLTLPKAQQRYESKLLFPFFFNMLSEGVNRQLQSRTLQLDENDHFGLLLAISQNDGIGAVSIVPIPRSR